jgi:hypothetical protein
VAREDGDNVVPLSYAQERLWFVEEALSGQPTNRVAATYRFTGDLHLGSFQLALAAVVDRHESLRTVILIGADGLPHQRIQPALPVHLTAVDVSDGDRPHRLAGLQAELTAEPFDLANGPLIRVCVARLRPAEHAVILVLHHLVTDGWSWSVLERDLANAYECLLAGRRPVWPEPVVQYADFTRWERQWLSAPALAGKLDYWRRELTGLASLELPTDRPRPDRQSFAGDAVSFVLPDGVVAGIRQVCRQERVTAFMVCASLFAVVLGQAVDSTDIPIGYPSAGRIRPELAGSIGFFANTLVLRCDLADAATFRRLLHQVRHRTLGGLAHQEAPFAQVVAAVAARRQPGVPVLCQVMCNYQGGESKPTRWPGLTVDNLPMRPGTARFDLELFLFDEGASIDGSLNYATVLFDRSTIVGLVDQFQRVAVALLADLDAPVSTPGQPGQPGKANPSGLSAARTPPRTATEQLVAAVWCRGLDLRQVYREDDFFVLGGHSLLGVRLLHELGRRMGCELPVSLIPRASVLSDLAAAIDAVRHIA